MRTTFAPCVLFALLLQIGTNAVPAQNVPATRPAGPVKGGEAAAIERRHAKLTRPPDGLHVGRVNLREIRLNPVLGIGQPGEEAKVRLEPVAAGQRSEALATDFE